MKALVVLLLCMPSLEAMAADSLSVPKYIAASVDASREADSAAASDVFLLPMKSEIFAASKKYHVPASLVAAFIQEESAFDAFSIRTESGYLHKRQVIAEARAWSHAHHGIPSELTERYGRATSWGPMQVMGQTAREQGFGEKFLSELIRPFNSIDQGAKLLSRELRRYRGDTLSAISAYNQGNNRRNRGAFVNARYVYRVTVAWERYREIFSGKNIDEDLRQTNQDHRADAGSSRDDRRSDSAVLKGMRLPQDTGRIAFSLIIGQHPAPAGLGRSPRFDSTAAVVRPRQGQPNYTLARDALSTTAGLGRHTAVGLCAIAAGLACLLGLYRLLFAALRHVAARPGYALGLPRSVDKRVRGALAAELAASRHRRSVCGPRQPGHDPGFDGHGNQAALVP